MYTNVDQTLVNSLHGLLNYEIRGLDCHVITREYKTRVHCIHRFHLFCNALGRVIYSVVSGPYSYTIYIYKNVITHDQLIKQLAFTNISGEQ